MPVQGTRLETDEDVRQALQMQRPASPVAPTGRPTPADDSPPPWRPVSRPPTPLLTIFDDGAEDGETVRVRKDRFVIGRTEGDLVIPNDTQMSSRHAELRQSFSKGKHRWTLIDLNSTNGVYVRIGHAVLEHNQEFLVGRTRYRFECTVTPEASVAPAASPREQATRLWHNAASPASLPAVVELGTDGSGSRAVVSGVEFWIGRDPGHCQLVASDSFASARHAVIRRDGDGRWVFESNKAANGLWLRIDQITFSSVCRFLLGEQMFSVRVPK